MLGGLDPVIIFTIFKSVDLPFGQGVKLPLVPIPVYLSEKIFEIAVNDYSKSISVDNKFVNQTFFERIARTDISMSLQCVRDNLVATILSALFDTCTRMTSKQDYSISLFYDDIVLVNGCISSFASYPISGTNMRIITFSLSDRNAGEPSAAENLGALELPETPELVIPTVGTPAGF